MNALRIIIPVCVSVLAGGLSACQTLGPSRSGIVDLTHKLHLTRVGDLVTDGHTLFICVENSKHVAYLMNTATYRYGRGLPFSAAQGCDTPLPPGLRRVKVTIRYRRVRGISADAQIASALDAARAEVERTDDPSSRPSSFGGGALFLRTVAVTENCGPNLPFYYTVDYPTGASYSFYLIVRLKQPVRPPIAQYCDLLGVEGPPPGRERVYQFSFGDEGFMHSIDIGNGTTLLIDGNSNAAEPVLLAVRSLPATVWSSEQNIFIVPREQLQPLLDKAGQDSTKRVDVFMRLLGQPDGYSVVDQ